MLSQLKKLIPLIIRQYKDPVNNPIPIYQKNNDGGIKIHIGSGLVNLQGWVNIEARNYPHIHLVTDKVTLKEFREDSISEIYLCHVREHFSFK